MVKGKQTNKNQYKYFHPFSLDQLTVQYMDTSTNREMYEVGNVFSGNIRTREISVSQIGMKPGRHITGNARRRKCIEKLQRRLDFS